MLAEEMRRAALKAIDDLKIAYKDCAFELLAAGDAVAAKEQAAVVQALANVRNHVSKALRRVWEDE